MNQKTLSADYVQAINDTSDLDASVEIIEAIARVVTDGQHGAVFIAEHREEKPELYEELRRVWGEPDHLEMIEVRKRAFEMTESDELYWGVDTITRGQV